MHHPLRHPRNAALALAYGGSLLAAVVAILRSAQPAIEPGTRRSAVALGLCMPFLLAAALLPTPTWYQYYYALVPFLVVGTIVNLAACGATAYRWVGVAAALPVLLGALSGARYYLPYFATPPSQ